MMMVPVVIPGLCRLCGDQEQCTDPGEHAKAALKPPVLSRHSILLSFSRASRDLPKLYLAI
jgi:hypothetical protein